MFKNNQKFTNLKEYLLENFLLGKLSTHGPCHWHRVLKNGLLIAKEDQNIDKLILILFSYIHDSKRIDEYKDAKHRERAAGTMIIRFGFLPPIYCLVFSKAMTSFSISSLLKSAESSRVKRILPLKEIG